ncbi:MAG: fibrobacter succinogenes major paralogous domain-containing protein [Bacteroidales bacterium]|nr:fibrobacter succinogenes major paralogous domain-containing protein [Bacteroidales bacterium]
MAGYTIMNCNLGTMQDEPSNVSSATEVAKTYGTMYQWGKKDPFPPFYKVFSTSGSVIDYSDYMGHYYDNENSVVEFASYARTSNELFYSLPGNGRPTNFDDAIKQSIQNPTAFLCGMNEAKSYSDDEIGWRAGQTSEELESILQENYPEPHDGNWLYDNGEEHFNSLWGGLDPEHENDLKTYNTGLVDKTDNAIHLYDAYGKKSIFDPCPYGWRVPPPDLWLGFTIDGLNLNHSKDNGYEDLNYDAERSNNNGITLFLTGWREGESSYFPTSGTRQPNGAALNAKVCGNYHNATTDVNSRVNILHVDLTRGSNNTYYFNIFENRMMTYYLKSTASSIRCVRMDSVRQ